MEKNEEKWRKMEKNEIVRSITFRVDDLVIRKFWVRKVANAHWIPKLTAHIQAKSLFCTLACTSEVRRDHFGAASLSRAAREEQWRAAKHSWCTEDGRSSEETIFRWRHVQNCAVRASVYQEVPSWAKMQEDVAARSSLPCGGKKLLSKNQIYRSFINGTCPILRGGCAKFCAISLLFWCFFRVNLIMKLLEKTGAPNLTNWRPQRDLSKNNGFWLLAEPQSKIRWPVSTSTS